MVSHSKQDLSVVVMAVVMPVMMPAMMVVLRKS
jgi:hypothetical protein